VRNDSSSAQGLELLRDLLTVEVPLTLNAALCEFHRGHCPATAELELECRRVRLLICWLTWRHGWVRVMFGCSQTSCCLCWLTVAFVLFAGDKGHTKFGPSV